MEKLINESLEKQIEDFFSIPEVVPNSKFTYEIYVFSIQSWRGVYQLDGEKHLFKNKVSIFNPNWKVFDDSEIADDAFIWTPIFGEHSECREVDFNEHRKTYLSYYNNISMWKFKSKKLIEKALEFYTDHHNSFRNHYGEFGIQSWFFDKYAVPNIGIDGDEFLYMLDKGTNVVDLIKPVFLDKMNEKIVWHTHAKQDVNYFNTEFVIRYKKIQL